jgi:hypothetical protein
MGYDSDKWKEARDAADEADSGGIFLSLKDDKDNAEVVFVGDPELDKVVWNGETYDAYDPKKHKDKKPSIRMKFNVFNIKQNAMQILNMSYQTFKVLDKAIGKYGQETVFEIERQGAKGDTNTVYTIMFEREVDKKLAKRIKEEKPHDLKAPGTGDGSNGIDDIKTTLKELSKEDIQTFLSKFGIKKIKDLDEDQIPAAFSFISQLKGGGDEDADGDVDPFAD